MRIHNVAVVCLVSIVGLFSASSTLITPAIAANSDPQSRCGDDDAMPNWALPDAKVQAWAAGCKAKIEQALSNEPKSSQLHNIIICTFLVEQNGHISDPFIWKSASTRELNDTAMRVIEMATPLPNPPKELGRKRVMISFSHYPNFELEIDYKDYKSADPELEFRRQRERNLY